jgi:hypothetical protein
MKLRFKSAIRRFFLSALLASSFLSNIAFGLPGLDPKYRMEVAGPNGTRIVLTRDVHNPYTFYYQPAELHMAKDASGKPLFHFREVVVNGKRHAILQVAVNGQADEQTQANMRRSIVSWFELERQKNPALVVPTTKQIALAPLGPFRNSNLQAVLFNGSVVEAVLSGAQIIDAPVAEDVAAPVDKTTESSSSEKQVVPHAKGLVGKGTLPGSTDLTQLMWVQYEFSGPGVSVIRELLSGKGNGGLILLYTGSYRALSPEYSVTVELDVHAWQSYFRDRHEERSGWSFLGLFGSSEHKIRDYIESRSELKQSLKIERIGGGAITAAQFDAIEKRLYDWITSRVFETQNNKPDSAAPAAGEIKHADGGGLLSVITGIPILSLPLGYGESEGKLDLRLNSHADVKATATWRGMEVEWAPMVCYASVSLGGYDDEMRAELLPPAIQLPELPTVEALLPPVSEDTRLVSGTHIEFVQRQSAAPPQILGRVHFGKTGWEISAGTSQSKNLMVYERGAVLVLPDQKNVADVNATIRYVFPPHRGESSTQIPTFVATQSPNEDGTIDFSTSTIRQVSLHIDEMIDAGMPVSVGATMVVETQKLPGSGKLQGGDEWQEPVSIPFGSLDKANPRGTVLFPGKVKSLSVHASGKYTDFFTGQTSIRDLSAQEAWLEREVAVLNEGGAGFIAVSPQTFGIRRFGISVNALRDVERVRVDITNGKQTKQVAIRITDSGALDELTGKMIPEGVLWFSTTSSPSVTAVVVEGPDRSKRNLSNIAMMNESWTQADGGTVLLVE